MFVNPEPQDYVRISSVNLKQDASIERFLSGTIFKLGLFLEFLTSNE
jgi:hypothetical protein